MQVIVNCFTTYQGGIVMLQKPRRGWWVLPGGKVDPDETWPEAVWREVHEEAGLVVDNLQLRGIYQMNIAAETTGGQPARRLLAQFTADAVAGRLLDVCKEGELGLIMEDQLGNLPMDEGDRKIIARTIQAVKAQSAQISYGRFRYTYARDLVDWDMTPLS